MNDPVVAFAGVQRWFGPHVVLRGLDLRIDQGQVYALLGRNGAGKSTALRILLGFLAPHRGTATVFGVASDALGPRERARIGYVGEEHRLYPTMTVAGAVAFERGTRPGFRSDFAQAVLQRAGLRSNQLVPRLSRGQRATLSLVLAVAGQPDLLVCDDPALGLDVVMRREFLDVLIDLLADTGCTVLFSSHFLADVERIADQVGFLHDGALLVDAPLAELKTRVLRGTWVPHAGAPAPSGPHVLRVGARLGGHELTLLDAPAELLAQLRATGALSPLVPPTLEELFLDLMGPAQPGLLTMPMSTLRDAAVAGEVR
jgi:ABC-2 type transport system ATP-binding protein